MSAPALPRAVCFFDCQNLFRSAQRAFEWVEYPDFDPVKLAEHVCRVKGWVLTGTRVYTGVPASTENFALHHFWTNKLLQLERRNAFVFRRRVVYNDRETRWPGDVRVCLPGQKELREGTPLFLADGRPLPKGTTFRVRTGHEKGVDVRVALDMLSLAYAGTYDVGVVFSQDQDLTEVVADIKTLAKSAGRWIKLASAFPLSRNGQQTRGVNGTDWVPLDEHAYRECLDPRDYWPKRP